MRANVNIKASSTCKGPADSAKKEKKKKEKKLQEYVCALKGTLN